MDFYKSLVDSSSDFHLIHKMLGCQDLSCDIKHFLEVMESFIYDPERVSYDQQRNLFIQHCFNYPKVFSLMTRLKGDKEKQKALQDFADVLKNYNLE